MALSYVADLEQVSFACLVSAHGKVINHTRLEHILKQNNAWKESDWGGKEKDADVLMFSFKSASFVSGTRPLFSIIVAPRSTRVWSTTAIVTCRVIGDDQVTERLILCSEDGLPAAELGRYQGKSFAIGQWQGYIEFIQVKVGKFTGKDSSETTEDHCSTHNCNDLWHRLNG